MNIYQKISQVMQDVAYLTKDDTVQTGAGKGYRAITEEKVTSTVRESLIRNGLVIIPIHQDASRADELVSETRTGDITQKKYNRITHVDVVYKIVNIDDPTESIDVVSSGTGVDTQDKGIGKAMTYAYKYMMLRTFAIPTGEDADKISSEVYSDKLYKSDLKNGPVKDEPTKAEANDTAKMRDLIYHLAEVKGRTREDAVTFAERVILNTKFEDMSLQELTRVKLAMAKK